MDAQNRVTNESHFFLVENDDVPAEVLKLVINYHTGRDEAGTDIFSVYLRLPPGDIFGDSSALITLPDPDLYKIGIFCIPTGGFIEDFEEIHPFQFTMTGYVVALRKVEKAEVMIDRHGMFG